MELVLRDKKNILTVSDFVFGYAFNSALVHQIIVSYMANARQGTSSQKNRSEVTGSNKKPWRQKGTGKARSGSVKSPIWRSGGVAFAAKTQDYTQKINKKMYRGALKSIFSELIRQNRLSVVENFSVEFPKTKILEKKLKDMLLDNVLIITKKIDYNLFLSSRNLNKVHVQSSKKINPASLISFNDILITTEELKQVEEFLE